MASGRTSREISGYSHDNQDCYSLSQLTPSPLGAPAGMPRSQVTHFLHVSAGGYFHKHACFCSMREICIRTFFLSGSTLLKVDDYLERSSLIEIISCLKPFFFFVIQAITLNALQAQKLQRDFLQLLESRVNNSDLSCNIARDQTDH